MMDQKNAMKLNPGGVHGGPTSQLDYNDKDSHIFVVRQKGIHISLKLINARKLYNACMYL